MKTKIFLLCAFVVFIFTVAGCGGESKFDGAYDKHIFGDLLTHIFYLYV